MESKIRVGIGCDVVIRRKEELKVNKRLLLLAIFGEQYAAEYKKKGYVPEDSELENVLTSLAPVERFVIEHRFADERMTLAAVGKICPRRSAAPDGRMIGFQQERVRQIEARALRKLRHPSRSKRLWPMSTNARSGHRRLDRWLKELGV